MLKKRGGRQAARHTFCGGMYLLGFQEMCLTLEMMCGIVGDAGSALDKTHWAALKDFKHEGLKGFGD